jgi:thiol-disulfide isomerase/thioredoxin
MASRTVLYAGACACAILGCGVAETGSGGRSTAFTEQSYEDAEAEARAAGKLFLVDATAVWCAPCRQMDKTTWTDPRVVAWMDEHVVAVKLDVDEDPKRATALRIGGMPTLIVFKEDREFDRVVGYRGPDELLDWLVGVRAGKRAIDALREAAGSREGAAGTVDVQARLDMADALAATGENVEAAEEYAWLWDHMLEHRPSMYGVRLSFMAGSMTDLAQRSTEARAVFTKLRDRYVPLVDGGAATRDQVVDWLQLNQVIGDERATLAWYDRVKDDPGASEHIAFAADTLFDLLMRAGRWADAGRLHPDPVGVAQRMLAFNRQLAAYTGTQGMDKADLEEIRQYRREEFRSEMAALYACCLAAGRDEPARQVAGILLAEQDDAEARQALVRSAVLAQRPLAEHLNWLEEAEQSGAPVAGLRRQLEAALAAQPQG